MVKIGLIINPIAGMGGAVGLKGSDGEEIQRIAEARGAKRLSPQRAALALSALRGWEDRVTLYAAPGEMGEDTARSLGLHTVAVGEIAGKTTAADTGRIAGQMAALGVQILLFAGGDGTARDICAVFSKLENPPTSIGIPAGVKIHSGVYATSPQAAGKALEACLLGGVAFQMAEVMDIDEDQYRQGKLDVRLYGYLEVPAIRRIIQNPKAASRNDGQDILGICEEIKDRIDAGADQDCCYFFGAGSTVARVMEFLGYQPTLLGVDVVQGGKCVAKDATASGLLQLARQHSCRLVVTVIGGQGHIFGRGNQQLSPEVLRAVGTRNIWTVAAASKIYSLPGQGLFVDTGDPQLDSELRGYRKVIVGWQETLVCKVD